MRWAATQPKPGPKVDDERIIVRFLWWPTEINGETRWLEAATIRQVAYMGLSFVPDGPIYRCMKWRNVGWV